MSMCGFVTIGANVSAGWLAKPWLGNMMTRQLKPPKWQQIRHDMRIDKPGGHLPIGGAVPYRRGREVVDCRPGRSDE